MDKIKKHSEICNKLTEIYTKKNKDYGNSFGLLHERCQLCQITVWASSNAISGSYNHTAFMEK